MQEAYAVAAHKFEWSERWESAKLAEEGLEKVGAFIRDEGGKKVALVADTQFLKFVQLLPKPEQPRKIPEELAKATAGNLFLWSEDYVDATITMLAMRSLGVRIWQEEDKSLAFVTDNELKRLPKELKRIQQNQKRRNRKKKG